MGTDRVELTLFPEYSTLVSAERNLEEYPLFELKARQRGSKARLFERVVEGEGGVSLRQTWKVIPSGVRHARPGRSRTSTWRCCSFWSSGAVCPRMGRWPSLYELRKVLGGRTTPGAPTARSGTRS